MALDVDLDIINAALRKIGATPIGDEGLEEESDVAQDCILAYEQVVDFNLGVYEAGFSFGRAIVPLSRNDTATKYAGYLYAYDLPPDVAGAPVIGEPMYLTDQITDPKHRFDRYAIVGKIVHSSATSLWAQVRFRPAPHKWSAPFRKATISGLASELAVPIREDAKMKADLRTDAWGNDSDGFRGGELGAAIRADSFSTPPRKANWNNNPMERAWVGDSTGSEADD